MMNWISTKIKQVPKDGNYYLAIWKGNFCFVNWDQDLIGFYIKLANPDYDDGYYLVNDETKIYYWLELTYPQEWIDMK